MRRASFSFLLIAAVAAAQTELPDWATQLSRVKLHLKQAFENPPSYVCQETLERLQAESPQDPLVKIDGMQMEVTIVGNNLTLKSGKEQSLRAFNGLLGMGATWSLPQRLFVADAGRIQEHREQSTAPPFQIQYAEDVTAPPAGKGYDFEIPAASSAFNIQTSSGKISAALAGSFWVDEETLDLIRIADHAVDLPWYSGLREIRFMVDYARTPIGKASALLPQREVLVVHSVNGPELRNEVTFSACREYLPEAPRR